MNSTVFGTILGKGDQSHGYPCLVSPLAPGVLKFDTVFHRPGKPHRGYLKYNYVNGLL